MIRSIDKRSGRRLRIEPAVAAVLSHVPVTLIDISTSGAQIRHDTPLAFTPVKRYVLHFTCDGDSFDLGCTVARSSVEPCANGRRQVYTSGLKFTEIDPLTAERLWGLIGVLAIGALEEEAMAAAVPEFEVLAS